MDTFMDPTVAHTAVYLTHRHTCMHVKYKQPRSCAYTHVYMPACSLEADWDIKHRITMNKSASERTKKKKIKKIYICSITEKGESFPPFIVITKT